MHAESYPDYSAPVCAIPRPAGGSLGVVTGNGDDLGLESTLHFSAVPFGLDMVSEEAAGGTGFSGDGGSGR